MPSSLYVHIPYCKNICTYCDFCKMYYNPDQINSYLMALEQELKSVYRKETLKTIYIGGGTPSCLSIKELTRLFQILEMTEKDSSLEYTIECNFDSINHEKLDLFKKVGINRLSFGLETTNTHLETYLGRKNDLSYVKEMVSYAKSIGIVNINIDLIYALKNETATDLMKDLAFILSLDVPHISTYSLMIEEHTILKLKGEKPITHEKDAKMYEYICETLKKNGYEHYEISNFAKTDFSSRHNLVYWENREYYGIGLGAAAYYQKKRIQNTRSITKYLSGHYISRQEVVTKEDRMIYEVLLQLRLIRGISLKHFYETYHVAFSKVFPFSHLVKEGLLREKEDYLTIPEDKLYISNYIIEELIYGKK